MLHLEIFLLQAAEEVKVFGTTFVVVEYQTDLPRG